MVKSLFSLDKKAEASLVDAAPSTMKDAAKSGAGRPGRMGLGLMRLGREYGADRLEAACARAQSIRSPSYKSIASILGCGLDQRPLDAPMAVQASLPLHENVRGPGYYH